jgi:K+-sensing histidine kinase KdpD
MRTLSFRRFLSSQSQWISHLRWFFAALVCGIAAGLLSLFFKSSTSRALVPLVCLVLIVLVAIRYGARAGILGSVLATVVFCVSLFPMGNLRVDDPAERANVVWMFLGGISLSYLLSSDDEDKDGGMNPS